MRDHVEPLLGNAVRLSLRHQERPAVRAATANAPAQLMQLGEPVPVGVEDHDAARLWHVHAHLDYCGRHHDRRLPAGEFGHHALLRLVVVAAGQFAESHALELWQRLQALGDLMH